MRLPLSIPVSLHEFLERLVDEPYMLGVLQRKLTDLANEPVQITQFRARVARSRSGPTNELMHVMYRLRVRVGDRPEKDYVLRGTAPLGPDDQGQQLIDSLEHLVGNDTIVPFHRPWTYLPELKLGLYFFAADPAMPALAELTGPGGKALLARYLEIANDESIEHIDSELKHYKAFNRAILRVTVHFRGSAADPRVLYLKVFADDLGTQSFLAFRQLWLATRSAGTLQVPEPIVYDSHRRLLVMSEAPGKPELSQWIRCLKRRAALPNGVVLDRVKAGLAKTAEALADLQASTIDVQVRTRTFADELRQLKRDWSSLEKTILPRHPDLAARVQALCLRLEHVAPLSQNERFVLAHGGFGHNQLVGNESDLTIVDWDDLCLASPCFDAAKFIAQIQHQAVLAQAEHAILRELATTFRREFLARVPQATVHELDLYLGLVFAQRAVGAFRRIKLSARRLQRVLAAAEALLDEVEADS